eukprot:7382421-Prymnesium_polylepis.1
MNSSCTTWRRRAHSPDADALALTPTLTRPSRTRASASRSMCARSRAGADAVRRRARPLLQDDHRPHLSLV